MGDSGLITRVHPEYAEYNVDGRWPFWRDSFAGGYQFKSQEKYLVKNPREHDSPEHYQHRFQLAVYEAFGKDCVNDWSSRLTGPGLDLALYSRDKTDAANSEFMDGVGSDIDLMGHSIEAFAEQVLETMFYAGMAGVFVDVRGDGTAKNVLEAEDLGVRPYCRLVEPWNIRDWNTDATGQLDWVKIVEPNDPKRDHRADAVQTLGSMSLNPGYESLNANLKVHVATRDQVITWTTDKEGKATDAKAVPHDLGVVPFVRFYARPQSPRRMFQSPLVEEIFSLAFLIYNLRNGLSEIQTNQMFAILMFADVKDGDIKPVGSTRALSVPGQAGWAPHFVSPDTGLVSSHLESIDHYIGAIKRKSKGVGITLVDDKVREASGRAKAFDTDPLTALLRGIGDQVESPFMQVFGLLHGRSIHHQKPFTGYAKFPDSVYLRGMLEIAEETNAIIQTLRASPTALRAALQNFALATLGKILQPQEIQEIFKELQGAPLETLMGIDQPNGQGGSKDGTGSNTGNGSNGTVSRVQPQRGAGGVSEQRGPRNKQRK